MCIAIPEIKYISAYDDILPVVNIILHIVVQSD